MLGEEFFSAIYAGFACWAVIADALEKRHEYPSLGGSEQQISPEDWDASFFCITCGRWWRDVGVILSRHIREILTRWLKRWI
jgi:hypothetical protein